MEISEATRDRVDDLLDIADCARRTLQIVQINVAAMLSVSDENEWVADCVAGGCDMEKMLAMTNTTVADEGDPRTPEFGVGS